MSQQANKKALFKHELNNEEDIGQKEEDSQQESIQSEDDNSVIEFDQGFLDRYKQEQTGDNENNDNENQKNQNKEQQKKPLHEKLITKEQMLEFNKSVKQKGVCYLSRIPPYMKITTIRNLLSSYGVERIYLTPEDESKRKHRIKKGGNRNKCFTDGWVEFSDKRVAKLVALSLNCTKMMNQKKGFYCEDLWNIRYLPKFKWENLTQKLAYDQRMRKEKLKAELSQANKKKEFYIENLEKSKTIMGMIERKEKKKQKIEQDLEQNEEEQIIKKVKQNDEDQQNKQASEKQIVQVNQNRIRRKFRQRDPVKKIFTDEL